MDLLILCFKWPDATFHLGIHCLQKYLLAGIQNRNIDDANEKITHIFYFCFVVFLQNVKP